MISPKAIRFARAMALVSQALPIPAAFVAGAAVAACDDKPAEHPVGLVGTPERDPVADASAPSNGFPEGAVGLVSAPRPANEGKEPPVGTYAAPPEQKVGEQPAPEYKVGKVQAPESTGKLPARDAGAKR